MLNHPGIVSPAARETVQAAIESLGYIRNDVARQLRAKDSRTIVFLTSRWDDPFGADMIRGAETQAFHKGLCLTLCPVGDVPEAELAHINHLTEQRVRGVIVAATADSTFTFDALCAGAPTLEVIRMMVFRKLITRPMLSVSLPSSRI